MGSTAPAEPAPRRRPRRPLRYALVVALLAPLPLELTARILRSPPVTVIVQREAAAAGSEGMVQATGDGRVFGARPGYADETYRIDSHGLRGPERALEKGEGTRRLLLLGDSVAFGQGIPAGDHLAPLLERELQRSGQPWEVWNLSFPGWNTAQEAAALEALGPAIQPDRIVVLWVPNDGASLEFQQFGEDGSVRALYVDERIHPLEGLSVPLQLFAWRNFALARVFYDWRGTRLRESGRELPSLGLAELAYEEALARLATAAQGLDAPLSLAMLPPLIDYSGWQEPLGPGRPAASYVRDPAWRTAVELTDRLGIERLDLTAAIGPAQPSTLRLAPDDPVHPSSEGHRRLAVWLAAWVESQKPTDAGSMDPPVTSDPPAGSAGH